MSLLSPGLQDYYAWCCMSYMRQLRALTEQDQGIRLGALPGLGQVGCMSYIIDLGLTDWELRQAKLDELYSHDKNEPWYQR